MLIHKIWMNSVGHIRGHYLGYNTKDTLVIPNIKPTDYIVNILLNHIKYKLYSSSRCPRVADSYRD